MRAHMILTAAALAAAAPVFGQEEHAGGGHSMCTTESMHAAGGMQQGAAMQHGAGMQHGAAAQQGQRPAHGLDHYITQPGRLLHHREELGLTADQATRIEALQAMARSECEQHMSVAKERHAAANEALAGATPDVTAFEARLREAADHMVQGHTAAVRRGVEALDLLTPQQREKLKAGKH